MSQRSVTVLGVDEAGRGSFAGPLVVAGVCIDEQMEHYLLKEQIIIRDSKTMSEIQREKTFQVLHHLTIPTFVSIISVEDINTYGIGWANYEGIKRVQGLALHKPIKETVVDGKFPLAKIAVPGLTIRCQVNADATEVPVMLAGIVAKVTRDRIMKQLHQEYPVYEWEKNKGYGTFVHRNMIKEYGLCVYHRVAFIH